MAAYFLEQFIGNIFSVGQPVSDARGKGGQLVREGSR
jgi:hypothetical protein